MDVTMLTSVVLALWTISDSVFIVADQQVVSVSTEAPQSNRTSKEFQEKPRTSIQDPVVTEFKTTGRKSITDDYNTFSSFTSDIIIETSSSAPANPKLYPSLTTSTPPFITRGRYIRNPFYFSKDDQEVEFDDDPQAELLLNAGMPKWNRYNSNHRQLNKYGPTPIEADITVDEDGSAGYGSTYDFGGGGGGGIGSSGYGDTGSYRNPGNGWMSAIGDSMTGWYSEPVAQSSRPVPIIAEIRQPSASHKMSIDIHKIGLLALIKIAAAKLKALGFIKAMLLVLFKIKLLILIMTVKMLAVAKALKLAVLLPVLFSLLAMPMFLSRLFKLNSLLDQPVLVPNNFGTGTATGTGGTPAGGGTGDEDGVKVNRRSSLDPIQGWSDSGMAYFRHVIKSEKCIERISCRMAGADKPSSTLIWLNWVVSPLSKYIPSKKIRTFVSTFTEVTNYRLDNLYSSLLPTNWTKWCNEHYTCDNRAKNKVEKSSE